MTFVMPIWRCSPLHPRTHHSQSRRSFVALDRGDTRRTSMTDARATRAGRRQWVGLAVLALAAVVYAMDLTVLHLAVPRISAELKPSTAQLLWIIDIYGFFVAGSLLTMGTLGDRVGRRKVLLIGAAAFSVTSVLAAFSTSRALMGLAGATIGPSTLSLIFNMFREPQQRSIAIGVWISSFSVGSAIGPLLGGVLLEYFWWGSVFLLALPVMALLLVLGPHLLPEYRDPQARRLDLRSAGMSLASVLLVIAGLKQIAQDGPAATPVLAIIAGLVLGTFFVRRQRSLSDPFMDFRLFQIRTFNVALATNVVAVFVVIGYFLFVAQYLQLVLGLSPVQAGLWSLPSALGFIVMSNVAPRIVHRVSPASVLGTCFVLASVGLSTLTQVGPLDGLAVIVSASVTISLALAPVFTLTTELIVGSAPPERAGAASGISETATELGGALGIAILGSIGMAVYRAALEGRLPAGLPAEAAQVALGTLGGALGVARQLSDPLGVALLSAARNGFVQGFHLAAALSAAIAIVAGVAAVITHHRDPANREMNTDEPSKSEFAVSDASAD